MTTIKSSSKILEAVRETAMDLRNLGFIDSRKMRQYDILCANKLPQYDGVKIKSLRRHYQISQTVLASLLNTSVSAVRQWEQGTKNHSGPSQKLLNILDRKGIDALF